MRPESLFPLFRPVTVLPGIGARLGKLLERMTGPHVVDLLWHLPVGLIDRRHCPTVAEARDGEIVTLTVTIGSHQKPRNPRSPYRVTAFDATGEVTLVFFHAREDWLKKTLPEGQERVISGRLEDYRGAKQMTHPDHMVPLAQKEDIMRVEPVYPLTAGLSAKVLGKALKAALEELPDLPEWLDDTHVRQQAWQGWADSLRAAHAPQGTADVLPDAKNRQRLAYDELLAGQLALALVRRNLRRSKGRSLKGDSGLLKQLSGQLPFKLTGSQRQAVKEILDDMAASDRMLRLLQGDVGSGKTIVALIAMLRAVEAGSQAALLAPTEILARQHFANLCGLLGDLPVEVVLLTGRDKGKQRKDKLAAIAEGKAQLIVGTHAIFQEDVAFKDLALAVVDEQHRFGVHQRLMLAEKADQKAADMLVMTATPIPRTLTLTLYGDMEVSRLTDKPPGRTPIETRAVPRARLEDVVTRLKGALAKGARAYWVCPLVEESDVLDLTAAEDRFKALKKVFGDKVALIHGRLKGAEKDKVMEQFQRGDVSLLVATTVVEVGVDVPEATIMVIEHAERFGLAQLHQLRGRVGRGQDKSTCLLVYGEKLSETAHQRLKVIRDTDDGFVIAEEDLRLRGAGEVLGTRQSGVPLFRLADLAIHGDLMAAAKKDADLALNKDPDLQTPRGKALRTLLYLFERDAAVRLLRSG